MARLCGIGVKGHQKGRFCGRNEGLWWAVGLTLRVGVGRELTKTATLLWSFLRGSRARRLR